MRIKDYYEKNKAKFDEFLKEYLVLKTDASENTYPVCIGLSNYAYNTIEDYYKDSDKALTLDEVISAMKHYEMTEWDMLEVIDNYNIINKVEPIKDIKFLTELFKPLVVEYLSDFELKLDYDLITSRVISDAINDSGFYFGNINKNYSIDNYSIVEYNGIGYILDKPSIDIETGVLKEKELL